MCRWCGQCLHHCECLDDNWYATQCVEAFQLEFLARWRRAAQNVARLQRHKYLKPKDWIDALNGILRISQDIARNTFPKGAFSQQGGDADK